MEGDFARRVIEVVDDAALALLMSIGHRTGLFDVMADLPPSTPEQIADAADLSEPCVREWLQGMERGGIVSRDPASGGYALPAEHAKHLSRAAFPANLAALAEYIPLLGAAEDRIVQRFQSGGQTPYDARPSFRQLLSKEAAQSDQAVVASFVDSILPLVPGLLEGLRSGIDVLDVVCGVGRAVNLAATTFPRSRFRGYDPSQRHIDRASRRAFERGLSNVQFRVQDIADLDEVARYDLITDFDALGAERRPRDALQNIARALRPGGSFLMQEVAISEHVDESRGLPEGSPLYTVGALAQMDDQPGGLRSEEKARALLEEAGFDNVVVHRLPHHIYNCYFIATRSA
jgi:SAM-dependent methyltransferase